MRILIKNLIPKKWIVEEKQKNILVNYTITGRGNPPKPFLLPKTIEMDKEFMTAIGMYLGDGKLSDDKHHLSFCSIDKDMCAFMLNFFNKKLNIPPRGILFTLRMRTKDKKIVKEWSKALDLPAHHFRISYTERSRNPSCEMQIGGVVLRYTFAKIMDFAYKKEILRNKSLRGALLQGLFAAEGNIGINYSENYIVSIVFCLHYEEKEIADIIKSILNVEGIEWKEKLKEQDHSRLIRVTGWKNYQKLWKIRCFKANERKNSMFIEKIRKTRFYCKVSHELKTELFNKDNENHRQLALRIGMTPSNLSVAANRDCFLNMDLLLRLCEVQNVAFSELKKNIAKLRVNRATEITANEFADFVLEEKLKLPKTWLP